MPRELAGQLDSELGRGRPLSEAEREPMERAFGVSFEAVHVHEDDAAKQLSLAFGAEAFTVGSDVFLGPTADAGDTQLLAHELTHVAQQSADSATLTNGVSALDDASEVEAKTVAAQVAAAGMERAATPTDEMSSSVIEPSMANRVSESAVQRIGWWDVGTAGGKVFADALWSLTKHQKSGPHTYHKPLDEKHYDEFFGFEEKHGEDFVPGVPYDTKESPVFAVLEDLFGGP